MPLYFSVAILASIFCDLVYLNARAVFSLLAEFTPNNFSNSSFPVKYTGFNPAAFFSFFFLFFFFL